MLLRFIDRGAEGKGENEGGRASGARVQTNRRNLCSKRIKPKLNALRSFLAAHDEIDFFFYGVCQWKITNRSV